MFILTKELEHYMYEESPEFDWNHYSVEVSNIIYDIYSKLIIVAIIILYTILLYTLSVK